MATNSGIQQTVAKVRTNELRANGISTVIGSETVTVTNRGINGLVSQCYGTTVPTDATAGYEVGCKFYKTDGTVGSVEYTNEGSTTSCDFNVVESAASTVTGVTAGTGLSGGGSSGTVTVNVGAGRGTTVRADNVDVGVDVYNASGGTLTVGTLVNLSGFNTTLGVTMTKADADAGVRATHVVLDAINDVTAGVVYPVGTAANVNTAGRTIGDLVYVSATAGAFTFTAPTGANQMVQIVGVVKVVDASVGEIVFFPGSGHITKIPQSMLQSGLFDTPGNVANYFAAGSIGGDRLQDTSVGGNRFTRGGTSADVHGKKYVSGLYDFSAVGGTQGTFVLHSGQLEANEVITKAYYKVLTTFTSGGGDAATVALHIEGANDLISAIAISDVSNPWDAGGWKDCIPAGAVANFVATTQARQLTMTVAGGQDLTAGKMVVVLEVVAAQLS